MHASHPATSHVASPYRNWKVKQYTVSLETRLAQERAERSQPPLMSLHAKGNAHSDQTAAA